ncbi:MAG TPA: hypothetical protein P5121_32860 [Caldilineaceae bacterium]|nr:hypothetical protein [Caldilineaceae bacterium]
MSIYAIDHIQIAIPPRAEDCARGFYIAMLGFTEVPKPPALADRGGLWLIQGDVALHLGVEQAFQPARKAHPGFLVDNLDAWLRGVKQLATDPPPTNRHWTAIAAPMFLIRLVIGLSC